MPIVPLDQFRIGFLQVLVENAARERRSERAAGQ